MKYFILLFTLLFHTLVYSQLNTSNRTVNQKLYFKAGANFDSLTADRPAYIDSSGDIVSQLLDLTSDVTGVLPLANGGTGSATQNFVDLTTNQSIAGQKTFTDDTTIDASGSGDALTITHSGSGDGLSISQSGSGAAATITGTVDVTGQINSDNLNLNGNTVSSTDINGNIILDPNGTGNVNLPDLTIGQPAYIDASGNLVSQDIDLTADVTGVLPVANGGTGSATQNFVDLTTNQSVAGEKTFTSNTAISPSGSGQALTITHNSTGNALDITQSGSGFAIDASGSVNVTGDLSVDNLTLNGNTLSSTDTNGNIILNPDGTGNVQLPDLTVSQPLYLDASGNVLSQDLSLTSDVTGILPEANGGTGLDASAVTDGQLLIGNSSDNTFDLTTLTGTTGQVSITNGNGTITLATPQDIATTSSPTFAGVTSTGDILMSGTGQIDIPVGTTAQRSGSPNSGMLRFNSDTSQFEGYDGSAWGEIGGTGGSTGGGGGGLDIFYNEDHETDVDSSDYTTGLNATFDNGGTLGGALANETTNPIAGATSIKYTTSATATNSTNDWIASASITLDDKQKGNFVGFNFFYTWDGSDDLLCVIVWDDTNNAVLNDSTDCLETASNPTRYSLGVFIPTSTNAIKLGFHHTGASESSKVLVFDDLELSSNPFVYKNLTDITAWESYTPTTQGFGTPTITQAKWRRVGDSAQILATFTTGTPTAVEAQFSLPSGLTVKSTLTQQSVGIGQRSNANGLSSLIATGGDSFLNFNNYQGAGVNPENGSSVVGSGEVFSFLVTVPIEGWTASAEHVVTPAKSGIEHYQVNVPAGYATSTKIIYFSNEVENSISSTGTVTNDGTSGLTFTANKKVLFFGSATVARGASVDVRYGWVKNPSNNNLDVALQGDKVVGGSSQMQSADSSFGATAAFTVLEKGDTIKLMGSGNTLSTGGNLGASFLVVDFHQEILAAVPMNYTQTKTLANDLPTGSMSELDFNNLVIGNWYEVTLQVKFGPATSTSDNSAQITHDSTVIGSVEYASAASGSSSGVTAGTTVKFKATATTVTFSGIGGGMPIQGNGTQAETFAQLTELNYTKETTRFE